MTRLDLESRFQILALRGAEAKSGRVPTVPLRLVFSLAAFLSQRGRCRANLGPFLTALGASLHAPRISLITRGRQSFRKGGSAVDVIRQRSRVQHRVQLAKAMQPNICGIRPLALGRCLAPFRLKEASAPTCQRACLRRHLRAL